MIPYPSQASSLWLMLMLSVLSHQLYSLYYKHYPIKNHIWFNLSFLFKKNKIDIVILTYLDRLVSLVSSHTQRKCLHPKELLYEFVFCYFHFIYWRYRGFINCPTLWYYITRNDILWWYDGVAFFFSFLISS